MNCDFLVFSSHKIYGPTGVGVLYAKEELLADMPPYQGGGDMITRVTMEASEYAEPPMRFEAGTPNIADVIALGTALQYFKAFSFDSIIRYEQELLEYAMQGLKEISGVSIIGGGHVQAPIVSFVMDKIHPHDVATIISQSGIAARAGHHCAMPTLQALGVPATTRISMTYYNTFSELDLLFNALHVVKKVFE
jgi:cysteine desulfurase/selenocysteine lyase